MFASAAEIAKKFAVAVVSVAIVFALTMLLTYFVETDVSTLYLAAVMFAAWRGGLGAGLMATVFSVAVATYFFLPPIYTFSLKPEGIVELVVFALAAFLIGTLGAARERALLLEQAARREAESANRVKDEFLATVSHELRTPLTTIKTLARLLLRQNPPEEKRREYLETISVECDRQIDLVLNLLDTSRIEGGVYKLSFESVRAEEVIRSCVKSEANAAEKRRHQLQVAPLEEEIPPICADPKALRRVLSNLIENAIKYTPDGGLITVSATAEKDFAAVSVADNGRGIASEDVPRLFDKFHRGKQNASAEKHLDENATDTDLIEDAEASGVGLGLYLARNIMEKMGGRITVETEVGRGSTFTLYLPYWNDAECVRNNQSPLSSAAEAREDKNYGETIARR